MLESRTAERAARGARKVKLALLGPAFVAAIGYIDPGNFATNIQAGASYGYKLLWVVVWANVMATGRLVLLGAGGNYRHGYRSGGIYRRRARL